MSCFCVPISSLLAKLMAKFGPWVKCTHMWRPWRAYPTSMDKKRYNFSPTPTWRSFNCGYWSGQSHHKVQRNPHLKSLPSVYVDVTYIKVPDVWVVLCKQPGHLLSFTVEGDLQNSNHWDFPWWCCSYKPGLAWVRCAQDRAAVRILQMFGRRDMSADAATYQ